MSDCSFNIILFHKQLVKKLHTVNEGLKKFAHVNKKAFEQYNNFTKQRDQLIQRREDLDKSAQSIEELVEVLDQRKDEAIERTFKQVAKNFEEVFEKLVPAGRGRLVIQRRIDQVRCIFNAPSAVLTIRIRRMKTLKRRMRRSKVLLTITLGCLSGYAPHFVLIRRTTKTGSRCHSTPR